MLVSLLFKAYTFKAKVPFRKHIFYRQVFDALFEAHDFTKGESFNRPKHSGLDIDDFHAVLRELGFSSAKLGRVDLSKDKILGLLADIRERRKDIKFQPGDFLLDLVSTVPLFTCEGSEYNWAHKSVQDYFASQFIFMDAKKDQRPILSAIYNSEQGGRFANVLDILHDTDPAIVRQTIIRKLLQDFVVHYENSYNKTFPGVTAAALQARKQRTFQGKTALTALRVTPEDMLPRKGNAGPHLAFAKLKKIMSDIGLSPKNSMGIIYGFSSVETLALAATQENRTGTFLLPILAAKKYDFVSVCADHNTMLAVEVLTENHPIFIDDDPASPLNSPENFEKTTAAIRSEVVLDYPKSKIALHEIEKEIAESVERDPLTSGI
ncbi:MAG: hypothetical protein JNL92_21720 [Opitutaceae bacterium]|nr:hypothetical protein [Opitutaceae bacterium]